MSDTAQSTDAVALIPAAGGGFRLGQGPKAFLQIGGKSLIQHVVEVVGQKVGKILVAVPSDHLEIAKAQLGGRAEVHIGGTTRLETVAGLLAKTSEPMVVVHDAARPFLSAEVLGQVLEAGRAHGAAAAFRMNRVPIALIEDGVTKSCIPRSQAGTFETPQAFQREILERTLQYARAHTITDEALSDLAIRSGVAFRMIADGEWNFKITTPLDWEIAKVIAGKVWGGERGGGV